MTSVEDFPPNIIQFLNETIHKDNFEGVLIELTSKMYQFKGQISLDSMFSLQKFIGNSTGLIYRLFLCSEFGLSKQYSILLLQFLKQFNYLKPDIEITISLTLGDIHKLEQNTENSLEFYSKALQISKEKGSCRHRVPEIYLRLCSLHLSDESSISLIIDKAKKAVTFAENLLDYENPHKENLSQNLVESACLITLMFLKRNSNVEALEWYHYAKTLKNKYNINKINLEYLALLKAHMIEKSTSVDITRLLESNPTNQRYSKILHKTTAKIQRPNSKNQFERFPFLKPGLSANILTDEAIKNDIHAKKTRTKTEKDFVFEANTQISLHKVGESQKSIQLEPLNKGITLPTTSNKFSESTALRYLNDPKINHKRNKSDLRQSLVKEFSHKNLIPETNNKDFTYTEDTRTGLIDVKEDQAKLDAIPEISNKNFEQLNEPNEPVVSDEENKFDKKHLFDHNTRSLSLISRDEMNSNFNQEYLDKEAINVTDSINVLQIIQKSESIISIDSNINSGFLETIRQNKQDPEVSVLTDELNDSSYGFIPVLKEQKFEIASRDKNSKPIPIIEPDMNQKIIPLTRNSHKNLLKTKNSSKKKVKEKPKLIIIPATSQEATLDIIKSPKYQNLKISPDIDLTLKKTYSVVPNLNDSYNYQHLKKTVSLSSSFKYSDVTKALSLIQK